MSWILKLSGAICFQILVSYVVLYQLNKKVDGSKHGYSYYRQISLQRNGKQMERFSPL
jgi:hypothetical protein